MIIKILKKSAEFAGVAYNTGKIGKDKAELVKAVNFHALKAISDPKPSDYINYLKSVTAVNKRIRYPQLHAVLSCKGKEKSKEELTEMAEKWLIGMGYGKQPYLLIFHNDTANNHIHMVSTRVDRAGKKINDSFERINAYRVLHEIEKENAQSKASEDIQSASAYAFSTLAQFKLILERKGYSVVESADCLSISKFGKIQEEIAKDELKKQMATRVANVGRKSQIKAWLRKYSQKYSPSLIPNYEVLPGGAKGRLLGYSSELTDFFKEKFGLEFIFHFSGQHFPYGFTILDHAAKECFKGSEIIKLARVFKDSSHLASKGEDELCLEENKDKISGLAQPQSSMDWNTPDLFSEAEHVGPSVMESFDISISDDIDDEQINGRNRRRQRKARTNTR